LGNFEDLYRKKADDSASRNAIGNISTYNKYVDLIKEEIPRVVSLFTQRPPESCYWLILGDEKIVCWEAGSHSYGWEGGGPTLDYFIMPNGNIFQGRRRGDVNLESWTYFYYANSDNPYPNPKNNEGRPDTEGLMAIHEALIKYLNNKYR